MNAGHITSRVKHMAVPIAMIVEDIKNQLLVPVKIDGQINKQTWGPNHFQHQSFIVTFVKLEAYNTTLQQLQSMAN